MADPDYTQTNIYGTTSADTVTYSVSDVATGGLIGGAKWSDIATKINEENSRRGETAMSTTGIGTVGAVIDDEHYNRMEDSLHRYMTSHHVDVDNNTTITASNINTLIDKLQAAGAVCVCNCNYCTCNCNYCTCNCNYSCTCNCNYSDERTKENVNYL